MNETIDRVLGAIEEVLNMAIAVTATNPYTVIGQ
jgi:hypothetical protein